MGLLVRRILLAACVVLSLCSWDDDDMPRRRSSSLPPTYTAAGTAQDYSLLGVTTLTITNVTALTGDAIVVGITSDLDPDFTTTSTVAWSGGTFSSRSLNAVAPIVSIVAAYNVTGGTHDVTIDMSAAPPNAVAATVVVIHPIKSSPQDRTRTASGSGTTPSTSASAATTQASEIVLGFIGTSGPDGDDAGTWSNGYTAGQRKGTTAGALPGLNVTIADGYKVLTATGAQTAAKTGITSADWAASLITLKGQ